MFVDSSSACRLGRTSGCSASIATLDPANARMDALEQQLSATSGLATSADSPLENVGTDVTKNLRFLAKNHRLIIGHQTRLLLAASPSSR